ncbi:RNA 2',3'-cyclic phosphodiesterase [Streptomyces clavuligerus]|uniref:RNA 2',3'-cyclic phosphodiesterase n=1 Tax=Streptomyces clavuligerus TaxID=1901 RepID=E2PZX2_STRCL|nr:RNA 2',3'-cyclic phosphodiesterase [Streptomyces clavuligerus]ANW18904.1 2'-5' RNA ligase [Streptomyces clavuligerus]AXU13480.1 RNA 2',3'-cyclic phosphodiesterase [Streptomyces clavuligerus]EFG08391.1 2'-5' RNA ligase [Streptomyces clavuligerus]MBY6303438.1 RNA 2',3'-cyclic phosphodiesterase [Streptomyces clavuligerus]QCS06263.1 RNA 2',3'-cyclic phosphodiesterase [Streptomyces clavuligerus]
MRLFAAVLPPPGATAELADAVARLRGLPDAGRLRWTGRAGWHFTLAFMGEVDGAVLPELSARLARAARRTRAFGVRLHGAGQFGGRVLWTGAAGDIDGMRMLAERSYAAAARSGVPMEEHRAYRAHLTVARSREDVDLAPFVAGLAPFEGTPWDVTRIALVRSRLPTGGTPGEQPRYETVGAWDLGSGTSGPAG